jgi:hypothetical protein
LFESILNNLNLFKFVAKAACLSSPTYGHATHWHATHTTHLYRGWATVTMTIEQWTPILHAASPLATVPWTPTLAATGDCATANTPHAVNTPRARPAAQRSRGRPGQLGQRPACVVFGLALRRGLQAQEGEGLGPN